MKPDAALITARFTGTGGPPPAGPRPLAPAERGADAGVLWLEYIRALYKEGSAGALPNSHRFQWARDRE